MNSENRAQLACAALLPDLIARGASEALASPVWVIGMDGMTLKVDGIGLTPMQHCETFDGWVAIVGAEMKPTKVREDGVTYLTAFRRYPLKGIVVVLRAEVAP